MVLCFKKQFKTCFLKLPHMHKKIWIMNGLWETYIEHPGCLCVYKRWGLSSSAPGRQWPPSTVCRWASSGCWKAGPRWGRRSCGNRKTPVCLGRLIWKEPPPAYENIKHGGPEDTLGTNWGWVRGGNESFQEQRAASAPGVLWTAAAPQPGPALQLFVVVKRLDLLRRQVKPAPLLLTLPTHTEQNSRRTSRYWQKLHLPVYCRPTWSTTGAIWPLWTGEDLLSWKICRKALPTFRDLLKNGHLCSNVDSCDVIRVPQLRILNVKLELYKTS